MKIALLGPPGSGKGTQAQFLIHDFKLEYIYPGEMLREEIEKDTRIGREVKTFMDKGDLVPTQFVVEVVKLAINGKSDYLLDGFPRSYTQLEHAEDIKIDTVLFIAIPQKEVISRLLKRGREDDNVDTIKHRYKVYMEATEPVIEYYKQKGILKEIDGIGTIEEVYARIKKVLHSSKN
jgi:adenylate kinase